jgi:hypothetical protein
MLCLFLSHVFKQRGTNLPEDEEAEKYEWVMLTELLWLREVSRSGVSVQHYVLFLWWLRMMVKDGG